MNIIPDIKENSVEFTVKGIKGMVTFSFHRNYGEHGKNNLIFYGDEGNDPIYVYGSVIDSLLYAFIKAFDANCLDAVDTIITSTIDEDNYIKLSFVYCNDSNAKDMLEIFRRKDDSLVFKIQLDIVKKVLDMEFFQ